MKNNSMKKAGMWAAVCLMTVALTACSKEAPFNQEGYDDYVKTLFGVTNVQSTHDWASVQTASANISVNETEGGIYKVYVYASNPAASTADKPCVALLEQTVQNGSYIMCPFNYPLALRSMYVSVVSPSNRRQVKAVVLNSGLLTCDFTDADAVLTTPVTSEPFALRYCFEENFPAAGDFDFNDLVLSVRPKVSGKTLTLNVSLDAVGAKQCLAAAIRLTGVTSSDLASYNVTKGFASPDGQGMGEWQNIDTSETFLMEGQLPNYSSNVAIVLFKDAHWAINPEKTSSGTVLYTYYNTVLPKDDGTIVNARVSAQEAVYTLEFNSAEKAKDMLRQAAYDVFVIAPYLGSYWEIHMVQNGTKTIQVMTQFKPGNYAEAYGDNTPWAMLLPGTFRYPTEGHHVAAAYGTAYHSFVDWAANSNQAVDWYNYPITGLVYE